MNLKEILIDIVQNFEENKNRIDFLPKDKRYKAVKNYKIKYKKSLIDICKKISNLTLKCNVFTRPQLGLKPYITILHKGHANPCGIYLQYSFKFDTKNVILHLGDGEVHPPDQHLQDKYKKTLELFKKANITVSEKGYPQVKYNFIELKNITNEQLEKDLKEFLEINHSFIENNYKDIDKYLNSTKENDYFLNEDTKKNFEIDSSISSEVKQKMIKIRERNQQIIKNLKNLYKNHCQISMDKYTFKKKKDGQLYSEGHHLIPLGKSGSDNYWNIIIVSPLIHRMLHYAKVSKINLKKIKDNKLKILINNKEYEISWKPEHFKKIQNILKS